jgi:hypothetical protein
MAMTRKGLPDPPTIFNFQWCGDDDGAGWRKLIEITETSQSKLAAPVHEVMIRERRVESGGLSSVGADCLHANT